jgi:hypothetical protein
MKSAIASLAALGLIASPALAAPTASKTMTTTAKGGTAKATTTVTTKVTPTSGKAMAHAKVKTHRSHSKAATAQAAHKPAKSTS